MPTSNTLFLIICSNTKRRGGKSAYAAEASLAANLAGNWKHELLKTRKKVFGFIKQDNRKRHNMLLLDLPRNRTLTTGPDFGGADKAARYLPAAQRYSGSFYRAMGSDAAQLLTGTPHHILILSRLYGLLRADEPIQDYSCHIDDHPNIRPAWTDGGVLSDVFLSYLKDNQITRVFDFTALAGYRELISWNKIQQRAQVVQVKHAFGQQSVGDGLLTPLGELLGQWLRADDGTLNQVATGTVKEISTDSETIYFTPEDHPLANAPREMPLEHEAADRKDEIVRLARCLKYLLAAYSNQTQINDLHPAIDSLKFRRTGLKVDAETARAMHSILTRRDYVEHFTTYAASPTNLADQRHDFGLVEAWASNSDRLMSTLQECQGS